MKKELISDSLEGIDDKYIAEAAGYAAAKPFGARTVRWIAAAACLVFVVTAGLIGFSIAAEAREYAAAVEFFEENGLSTEGLSRDEIKEVYRDITTRSFTNGKTAEVIRKTVPGMELTQPEFTPEELAMEWDTDMYRAYFRYHDASYKANSAAGIRYESEFVPASDELHGFYVLRCYRDDELLWSTELGGDYYLSFQTYTEYGTVVVGQTYYYTSPDKLAGPVLAFLDDNGAILWEKRFDHTSGAENITAVIDNRDGTFTVFSAKFNEYSCLRVFDPQGNELSVSKRPAGIRVQNVSLFGDGYLVQVANGAGKTEYIAKMDKSGNISESFSYEGDDCVYVISDMIEFGGRVYLSAYAYPKQEEFHGYYNEDVGNILEYVDSKRQGGEEESAISSDELTAMLRENYTAFLLVCDPEGGEPEKFVSVRGALGAALSVNGSGQLEWNVESIKSSFYSPATSSFSIGGTCRVYRYTFGADGALIGRENTGDETIFRR